MVYFFSKRIMNMIIPFTFDKSNTKKKPPYINIIGGYLYNYISTSITTPGLNPIINLSSKTVTFQ